MWGMDGVMPPTTSDPAAYSRRARLPCRIARSAHRVRPTVERDGGGHARSGLVRTFGEGRAARRVLDGDRRSTSSAGEIVAVLGRSGSGKSTLLHVLGGLDRPEAGVVEVAGERVTGVGERRLSALRRRHIGFVFQFFHLLPELSGEAQRAARRARARRATRRRPARGRALIDRLGLRAVAGSLPHQLSGGEQQRFAIARALVNDPSLLLADEPTGNLDVEAGAEVLALLRELADEGRAVVLVTHERERGGDRRPGAAARGRAGWCRREARARRLLAALGDRGRVARRRARRATVGYGLATGFDRAAARGRPPARHRALRPRRRARRVDARVRALPNLAARSYRYEEQATSALRANGRRDAQGRRCTSCSAAGAATRSSTGRDLRAPGEVVVERGLAREWDLAPGDRLRLGRGWAGADRRRRGRARQRRLPAHGHAARVRRRRRRRRAVPVNLALLWLADPDRADITLAQARATSFGDRRPRVRHARGDRGAARPGRRDRASRCWSRSRSSRSSRRGRCSPRARRPTSQRRLPAFGVQRALGFTPGRLAARQAAEAARVAVPAAAAGLAVGALAVAGPSADLLAQLNEQPPGAALLPVLAACLLAIVGARHRRGDLAGVARGAAPAGRDPARRRPRAAPRRARRAGAGLLATGARFAVAARGRWAASVATIAVCAGVVTLMLALASLLERLRDDPGTVGKRYQLTVRLNPLRGRRGARRSPASRTPPSATRSTSPTRSGSASRCGWSPTRATTRASRRRRWPRGGGCAADGEAEVGVGLADALGLRPGATLAVQTEGGERGALPRRGRRARARARRPDRVRAARPAARGAARTSASTISVRLEPGADRAAVERRARRRSARRRSRVGGATTRNAALPRRARRRCCAASGSRSGSSASTRSSRRSR